MYEICQIDCYVLLLIAVHLTYSCCEIDMLSTWFLSCHLLSMQFPTSLHVRSARRWRIEFQMRNCFSCSFWLLLLTQSHRRKNFQRENRCVNTFTTLWTLTLFSSPVNIFLHNFCASIEIYIAFSLSRYKSRSLSSNNEMLFFSNSPINLNDFCDFHCDGAVDARWVLKFCREISWRFFFSGKIDSRLDLFPHESRVDSSNNFPYFVFAFALHLINHFEHFLPAVAQQ